MQSSPILVPRRQTSNAKRNTRVGLLLLIGCLLLLMIPEVGSGRVGEWENRSKMGSGEGWTDKDATTARREDGTKKPKTTNDKRQTIKAAPRLPSSSRPLKKLQTSNLRLQTSNQKPKTLNRFIQDIPGTTGQIEMIQIPAGTITMPDPNKPGKKQQVKVKSLWMSKTEIVWDVYDIWAFRLDLTEEQRIAGVDATSRPSTPYGAPDAGFGHRGYAAIHLTFYAAEMFCKWLSAKTGKKYRLPTEAEWEYACRAGVLKNTPMNKETLSQYAWFKDNSENKAHAVGTKKPNAWGFYDMLGNVAEWCVGLDGKPVACGGSWRDPAERVHPGARQFEAPEWRASDPQFPKSQWWLTDAPFVGFRVVCEE